VAAQSAFTLYDVDHSGGISKEEAAAAIRALGHGSLLSDEYIAGVWSVYDADRRYAPQGWPNSRDLAQCFDC
jgi:Ca2+-binding EF-hand superfamily protein